MAEPNQPPPGGAAVLTMTAYFSTEGNCVGFSFEPTSADEATRKAYTIAALKLGVMHHAGELRLPGIQVTEPEGFKGVRA